MVGEMNYASDIPQEAILNAEREITAYLDTNKDTAFARQLLFVRRLQNPFTRKDIVRRVDLTESEDGISNAKIVAPGTVPDITKTRKKEYTHQIWFIGDAVLADEAALEMDPSVWNGDVSASMLECTRRESYIAINGSTNHGITGIVGAARANPNGKITAAASSGANVGNNGAWDGSETNAVMDPFDDLLEGVFKVGTEFPRSSLKLLGHPLDLKGLYKKNDLDHSPAEQVGPLFGRPEGDVSFIVPCDYVPRGYLYIVSGSQNCAEFVVAREYYMDANFPRTHGKQRYGEVGGYFGFEFHNTKGLVEIQVT